MRVKERQPTTDEIFQPLQETIELLKFYDQDIPEEVNVLLQELPEQWANTKKLALMVKQQVAPLQAGTTKFILILFGRMGFSFPNFCQDFYFLNKLFNNKFWDYT